MSAKLTSATSAESREQVLMVEPIGIEFSKWFEMEFALGFYDQERDISYFGRQRRGSDIPVAICKRCAQPSFNLTQHAFDRHFDAIDVLPTRSNTTNPLPEQYL